MATTTWNIDTTHSAIGFSVRHMVIAKVRGRFAKYAGTLQLDEGDMARSTAAIAIETASIDTGVADRDAHLRSKDFFDVEKFPELRFKTTRIEKRDDIRYGVVGDLTIHGVTREVFLDVEFGGRTKDPWGKERIGVVAKGTIDRNDFGLTWNTVLEAGGIMVGDRVDLELEVEAVRAA